MAYTDIEYKFKKIGKNVTIGKNVYFRYPESVELGDNVIIDEFSYFTTSVLIEDYVHISTGCSIIGGKDSLFIMREFSAMGAGSRIICRSDDFINAGLTNANIPSKFRKILEKKDVEIKKHAIIGTACVCHPGVIIGEGATIGSMSLITKDLEPWWVYFGVPAKKQIPRNKEEMMQIVKDFKNSLK